MSGVIEVLLIFAASIWIIYEAVLKLISPGPIESIGLGSLVMFISAVVNILVSRKLYKVAKRTQSMALEADALHLKADVYTSLGVALGLGLIWLTGFYFLDPIVAIAVAIFILYEAYHLLKKAFAPLLDVAFEPKDLETVETYMSNNNYTYHKLRTRLCGKYKFADILINFDGDKTLDEVQSTCDLIEKELKEKISFLTLTIHVEPFKK